MIKQFIIKLFLFSFFISIIDFVWVKFLGETYPVPNIWSILTFFVLITLSFHVVTMNATKGKPQNFIRFYMGSTALRMALCVVVVLVYRFVDKPTVIPFSLAFLAHYFLFTIFEVTTLLKELKR